MMQSENKGLTSDLFADLQQNQTGHQELCPGAVVLRGFAVRSDASIFAALRGITSRAPFRRMTTPGGFVMSVALTNCGSCGWVADRTGYRYDAIDPENGKPWPSLPKIFLELAREAAANAGFKNFKPDACLINCYNPGARLSLHQDKNECDFDAPIVSVSLGVPAVFLFGGLQRMNRSRRIPLVHGDVVVWGGPARLCYHGILPLKEGYHPLSGKQRINLTFRKTT